MKILLVGDWRFEIYEKALGSALTELGHEVVPFNWSDYFLNNSASRFFTMMENLQLRLRDGPSVRRMNSMIVKEAVENDVDAVFVFRGDLVVPESYRLIKKSRPNVVIAAYHNDNPFADKQRRHRFRNFCRSLASLDIAFAYRPKNVADFLSCGAPRVELLPPWFIPENDRPIDLSQEEHKRFDTDVVFIGHFEPDGRQQILEAIALSGHKVRLFGTGWEAVKFGKNVNFHPVVAVRDLDYRKALCAAKIALVFLSKVNEDRYTRRNFEIPATKTFMLSEYTEELERMFVPGREADYFIDQDDILKKVRYYLQEDEIRRSIALAGYERAYSAGYDVVSRARFVVDCLADAKGALKNVTL